MANLSFRGKRFKIVNKFFIFLAISLVIILAGVADIIIRGMNIGLEFSAGATIEVNIKDPASYVGENGKTFSEDDFKKTFTEWLKGDRRDANGKVGYDGTKENPRQFNVSSNVPTSNGAGEITFEFRYGTVMTDDGKEVDLTAVINDPDSEFNGGSLLRSYTEKAADEIEADVKKYLSENFNAEEEDVNINVYTHTIDNSVMLYTIRTAFIAASVAIVVMLIYIMIRFTWISGIAAILALLHDVLIMVACTTFFQVAVNSTFIAAVITIIGYSINATIVVFDRVRELENSPSFDGESDTELANAAVTGTLARSILTTLTTLVVIILLAIFGNAAIREFAYPIVFGLIAGAYSSVLLSASFWVYLRKLFKQSGKRNKRKVRKNV